MNKIIKSIFYELNKSKLIPIIFFVFLGFFILVPVLGIKDCTGATSEYFLENSTLSFVIQLCFLGLSVGIVCCSDMKDKVMNFEVLSGHSRMQVYMARVFVSCLIGTLPTLILSFVPLLIGLLIYGWGNKLSLSGVVIRQFLYFFPYLRLTAFFVLLSFLIKNRYAVMAMGVGLGVGSLLSFNMFSEVSSSVFLSIYNLKYLSDYVTWQIYNVDPSGTTRYSAGSSSIDTKLVLGTIGISLLMSFIYFLAGYALFRRDELN